MTVSSTGVNNTSTIKQHESRYETLWNKRYHLSQGEEAEFSHLSANRPLEFLDKEGNKALAKSLEGKSDKEKGMIKAIIRLEFTTSIKMNNNGNIVHGERDFSKKNKDEVVNTLQKFIDNFYKGGGVDTIGTMDVLKDFLSIYTKKTTPEKTQFTEEIKSKNLEQFYSKDIEQPSEKTKVSLSSKDDVSKTEKTPLKDALETKT